MNLNDWKVRATRMANQALANEKVRDFAAKAHQAQQEIGREFGKIRDAVKEQFSGEAEDDTKDLKRELDERAGRS